jgi:hypothetical protein
MDLLEEFEKNLAHNYTMYDGWCVDRKHFSYNLVYAPALVDMHVWLVFLADDLILTSKSEVGL